MHNANPVDTPMDKGRIFSRELCSKTKEEKKLMAKIPYASACRKFDVRYDVYSTRPVLCSWNEYVACTSAVQEAIWLRRFLKNLRNLAHIDDAIVIYCDNTTMIAYAKDTKYHARTKHIDTSYHFIRDSITDEEVVRD
ncbi:UNVERIFIED_CONTAM: Retrovirus-related Pol polyprotein from transposon TNT 1-94 [Sesamum latifolium]|uniref:Retrovirus-related Pol polyprotein from transposon TNT 1-94 n=1 Tax=Sesamum latifolium TaxID=2727402 RepID=A0AAW2XMM6_9LAMI